MSCNVMFLKQMTAYDMRITDWSTDLCSSDLRTSTADFIVIDVLLPAFVNAFGARRFDPGALTILDALQLHIGDHAEYGDDHSPHVDRRSPLWPKDAQRSSIFIKQHGRASCRAKVFPDVRVRVVDGK